MEEIYTFDTKTKQLNTGGDVKPCLPGGVGKIIFEKMQSFAKIGLIAQIEAETGYEDSFKNFLNRCIKLAIFMKQLGIKPNDVISSCSSNNLNNATVFISCLFIGAIPAATDPVLSLTDTTYLVKLIEPKIFFVSDNCIELIQKALTSARNNCKLIVLQEHNMHENLPVILNQFTEEDTKQFEATFIEDTSQTACIQFSSGTTGLPKGTCLSHDYLSSCIFSSRFFVLFERMIDQDVFFNYTTLYWISAVMGLLSSCYFGIKRLISHQFQASTMWDLVNKYKVNKLMLSYYHCMETAAYLKTPITCVKQLLIVGGQIPAPTQNYYGEMLTMAKIVTGYGMTEIGGVSVNYDYKNLSTGKPSHKNQIIKIVDPDTEQPLDLNQTGEIRIKRKYQMNGYYRKNSADCWDSDGFFKTGDVGYLTNDFELFMVDRIKEMFKYRSWHVIPAKIERHLIKHACVHHCVVIGVPVAADDNHAMAIVVLKDNNTVNKDELLRYVNDEMDHIHQIRAGVRIVKNEEIPYTITGKINRRLLKEQILSQKS